MNEAGPTPCLAEVNRKMFFFFTMGVSKDRGDGSLRPGTVLRRHRVTGTSNQHGFSLGLVKEPEVS